MIVFFIVHIMVATLLGYMFALVTGGLQTWSAGLSLFMGAVFARLAYKWVGRGLEDFALGKFSSGISRIIELVLFVFLFAASYRHFAWMFYQSGSDWKTFSLNNYGDLPLHINYIRYFAQGAPFPPLNPSFAQDFLRYPLGMDLYNALWETVGVNTSAHLFVVGVLAFILSFIALRAWGGWIAVGGLFLNGGLLGFEALRGFPFNQAAEQSLAWKNIFLTVFITQRGVLFAIPAGILLLQFARRVIVGDLHPTKLQLQIFGVLWGSLALFHLHTFFILSLIIAAYAVLYWSKLKLASVIPLVGWALPLGTLFTLYSTGLFKKASIVHWRAGWMAEKEGLLNFLGFNFGPWVLAIVLIPIGLYLLRKKDLLKEYVLALILFVLFMNLMLAPWPWDNIKVLIWPYILMLGLAGVVIRNLPQNAKLAEIAIALILFYSGTTMIVRTWDDAPRAPAMISIEALGKTKGVTKNLPVSAIFAAAPTHDHSLAYMGRLRVLGYEGHNWSHGIKTQSQTADLNELMSGRDDWRAAAGRLKVTHIFWGPHEDAKFGPMPEILKTNLTRVAAVPGYEIYEMPRP